MKTKAQIHDSLFSRPVTKAALYAYLYCRAKAVKCGTVQAELRAMCVRTMDRIADRFGIRGLALEFQLAA